MEDQTGMGSKRQGRASPREYGPPTPGAMDKSQRAGGEPGAVMLPLRREAERKVEVPGLNKTAMAGMEAYPVITGGPPPRIPGR